MPNFIARFKNDKVYLEILGESNDENEYNIEFIDLNSNESIYENTLKINHWCEFPSDEDKNILIRVTSNEQVVFERRQDHKFNKVYIAFGSTSIGDNIAWIPYVDEYRKINNVDVVCFTYHNYLFDNVYPDINFTDISNSNLINDVDKKFKIDYGPELYLVNGVLAPEHWYIQNKNYDNFVDYFDYRSQSLQSIASLILGLENKEIKSNVNIPKDNGPKIKSKYVIVAIQSTAQLKYWNNPFGWERLFDFLGRNGYKVMIIDKFKNFGVPGYYNQAPKAKNVIDKTGNFPLSDRITDIKYADMIITISSGLAWIAWAIGTPVVMISGFTKPWNEFQFNCARVHNSNVCNGCWNDPETTFDPSNWLFCPKNQNFICSKAIQPKDVTDAVKKFMK
jgi:autotransporter strand-loop-strand O-heptosyltransferase